MPRLTRQGLLETSEFHLKFVSGVFAQNNFICLNFYNDDIYA